MSDREVYLDDHGRSHGEPSDLVIAKLGARARKYRRALEEIRDYEMEQEDFVGIANVMQAIAEKALEEE